MHDTIRTHTPRNRDSKPEIRMTSRPTTLAAPILIAILAGQSLAQDTQRVIPVAPEEEGSASSEPSDDLPRMGTNETPIPPSKSERSEPHHPGLTGGDDWMRALSDSLADDIEPATLPEGTFIISRPGRLVPAPNERVIFVPDHAHRLPGEGPMLILPSASLARLEQVWANQPVILSGEVFRYREHTYLLVSDSTIGAFEVPEPIQSPDTTNEDQPDENTAPAENAQPSATLEDDPEVRALLDELQADIAPTEDPRAIEELNDPRQRQGDLESAPPALAPGIREGAILVRRAARLVRANDGAWSAVFDNDDMTSADGIDLTLLPCLLSERMENAAIAFGPETRFTISGRITIHHGRAYILPTFYQRTRPGEIEPWQ